MEMKHLYSSDEKLKWWGHGEWVEEPDEVNFFHNGISCRIIRMHVLDGPNLDHHFGGYLNGYIAIPKDHPSFGKHYDDIPLDVHGGLTFCQLDKDDNYWIGFDCAHSHDLSPSLEHLKRTLPSLIEIKEKYEQMLDKLGIKNSPLFNPTYKNLDFCIGECKSMAEQLSALVEETP